METQTLELESVSTIEEDDEPGILHEVCSCDVTIGVCGVYIDGELVEEDEILVDEEVCVLCELTDICPKCGKDLNEP